MPNQRERNAVRPGGGSTACCPAESQRYALRLAFDGTTYQGFQSQPYGNTVQDQVERRLAGLLKRPVRIAAWGRTDRGVHARGAVATVDLALDEVRTLAKRVVAKRDGASEGGDGGTTDDDDDVAGAAAFLRAVRFPCNAGAGADDGGPRADERDGSVRTTSVVPVPPDFDARYAARWKRYAYHVCAGDDDERLPFAWHRYAWRVPGRSLDEKAMADAAALLSGRHDFGWLCVMQRGELRDPRREVRLTVEAVRMKNDAEDTPFFLRQSEGTVIYKITGTCDFFLYKMMRRIVGVLVSVGKHDASLDELKRCLDTHDNNREASQAKIPVKLLQTAPAKGLCLEHIEYDIEI